MPLPAVAPSAPVVFWMIPPVQSAAFGTVGDPEGLATPPHCPDELPVTLKPPGLPVAEVFWRTTPFAPPLAETVVSVMFSGVLLAALAPAMLRAAPPAEFTTPPAD